MRYLQIEILSMSIFSYSNRDNKPKVGDTWKWRRKAGVRPTFRFVDYGPARNGRSLTNHPPPPPPSTVIRNSQPLEFVPLQRQFLGVYN